MSKSDNWSCCDSVTAVTLSHFFAYKCWVCAQDTQPIVLNCVLINLPSTHGEKKNKNGHFINEILVFDSQTKNAQNAIFQFST